VEKLIGEGGACPSFSKKGKGETCHCNVKDERQQRPSQQKQRYDPLGKRKEKRSSLICRRIESVAKGANSLEEDRAGDLLWTKEGEEGKLR